MSYEDSILTSAGIFILTVGCVLACSAALAAVSWGFWWLLIWLFVVDKGLAVLLAFCFGAIALFFGCGTGFTYFDKTRRK